MPVLRSTEGTVHEMHGSRFTAYVAPSHGSTELCAWRLEVPAGTQGSAHHVSREEVLHILSGILEVSVDGTPATAEAGDTVLVPAGSSLRVDNPGTHPVAAWVTTSAGIEAVLADGTRLSPLWSR
ncbi:mannose-6-phosphate isomerase-like protein (cupin superfamily) [Lipingzhangella halophila]|uniref:Mannose-6-phosphate isomerase-like protein (Cupin superfamily) n=1 Tax=Lipingzhangella halophila TaxID=1783352 RepID=A0A7W7W201_9ACTN|nr:cupin domain-containing protein [Lipingzhangella halophila]MBB4930868.1 mannose-6-phosphate isomerase-like protein (cupin superfamily) [Lipingzhangella halophila]